MGAPRPIVARFWRRSWGLSDVHSLRRRTRPVLEGLLDLTKAIPFKTGAFIGQGARRHVPNAGKESELPWSVVEIDF